MLRLAREPESIRSLVVVTRLTGPKIPSRTNLCVFVPSRVPVVPNLYSDSEHLVRIDVSDLALKLCASSPITQPNSENHDFCNLKMLCQVEMTIRAPWIFSRPP